jgi:hypothetical protein
MKLTLQHNSYCAAVLRGQWAWVVVRLEEVRCDGVTDSGQTAKKFLKY